MAKYSIAAVEPTKDGSGNIAWDVWALDDDGLVIPGRHKTILTPYDEAQDAITGAGVLDKVKALLLAHAGPAWADSDACRHCRTPTTLAGVHSGWGYLRLWLCT